MNPADLTLPSFSPTLTSKTLSIPQSSALKNGKVPVPRVELEPIYTQLKAALGDHWADYKAAVNAFVLGNLNQAELSWVLQPILSPTPSASTTTDATRLLASTLHLHNTLIVCLHSNVSRDPPPSDVAPWVVATDKPTTASKSIGAAGANDKAEERLKRETMSLHARDRRRIKTLKVETAPTPVNDGLMEIQAYHNELAMRHPPRDDGVPPSAGGMGRTSWDLESRRRYAQPLACETLEFPSTADLQSRIEPIATEEGLAGATQTTMQACAEMLELALQVRVKQFIGDLMGHSRSDGEGCIQTSKHRRQLQREEEDAERGILQRNPAGLLPVQMEVQNKREPLGMSDLRLGFQMKDEHLRRNLFAEAQVMMNIWPEAEHDVVRVNGFLTPGRPIANGTLTKNERGAMNGDNPMAIDETDFWQGGTTAAKNEVMGELDDILSGG